MTSSSFAAMLLLAALVATTSAITVTDYVRMRCSLDPDTEVIMAWNGAVSAFPAQEKQQVVFEVAGMNIARCMQNSKGEFHFTSRELMYYLDPTTKEPLSTWVNPWTKEEVTVVHVANNPVQSPFGMPDEEWDSGTVNGGFVSFVSDTNLFYENPLFGNATYTPYAPYKEYEGGEYFKFFTPQAALDAQTDSVTDATFFSWSRTSQWLPWMTMYNNDGGSGSGPDGYMLYSCTGGAVAALEDLPAFMVADIRDRLPLYEHAPPCYLDVEDETSWTYFGHHYDAFLAGDQFPVPAPNQAFPCQFEPARWIIV